MRQTFDCSESMAIRSIIRKIKHVFSWDIFGYLIYRTSNFVPILLVGKLA